MCFSVTQKGTGKIGESCRQRSFGLTARLRLGSAARGAVTAFLPLLDWLSGASKQGRFDLP
jgi:hypothetical protein